MKSRKIFSLFSFVVFFGLLTTSYVPVCVAGEKMDQFKTFVKSIPGQLKEKINAIDYDTSESLNLVFAANIKGKTVKVGVKIGWEPGTGDLSKGFLLTPMQIVSPTLGDLVPSLPSKLGKARTAQILLGIGTKDERNIAKSDLVKNVMDPVRDALKPSFGKFGKMIFINSKTKILYIKPVHIFFLKLIILMKSYAQGRRGEIPGQLRLLFLRLLQSVNVDKTIAANDGEMNDRLWEKKVFMSDPSSIVDILPDSVKKILTNIKVPVPAADYQDYLDFNGAEKNSESGYRFKISEVFKRNDGNSRLLASIREIQPLFETEKLHTFDASLLVYICVNLVRYKSKISPDLIDRLDGFLSDSKAAISNMEVKSELSKWKEELVSTLNGLTEKVQQGEELERDILFSEIVIPGKENVSLIPAVAYYFFKIRSIMNTRFSGDDGYLFMDYKIGQKKALYLMSIVLFRVYKDLRKAFRIAMKTTTWKETFKKVVGSSGRYDSVATKWTTNGTGAMFEAQKAAKTYKKTKTAASKKALTKAKALFMKAKAEFNLLLIKGFKFKRAKNIDEETIWDFLLREITRLSLRCDKIAPVIEGINSASVELLGLPLIEDESKFEEELPDDEEVDEFGFEEDFDDFDF